MSLSIAQHSQPEGRNHWSWSVALAGTPQELDEVAWVEYTLHPTFSPPVHRVADRGSNFRLDGSGWGEFMIHVTICHQNGEHSTLQHWLELNPSSPPTLPQTESPLPVSGSAPPQAPAPAPRSSGAGSPAPPAPQSDGAVPRCTVFLSSGLADRPVARRIEESLASHDVTVATGEDLQSPTDSVETMIRDQLERVDGAIFLVSNRQTPWLRQEVAAVAELGLPVAVVHTGGTWPVPHELETMAALTMDIPPSAADGAELATLLAWAVELPRRNKRSGSRSTG